MASRAQSVSQPLATAGGMLSETVPLLATLPLKAMVPLLLATLPLKATVPVLPKPLLATLPLNVTVPVDAPTASPLPLLAALPLLAVLPLSPPVRPPALPLSPKPSRAPVLPPQPSHERAARAPTHPIRATWRFMSSSQLRERPLTLPRGAKCASLHGIMASSVRAPRGGGEASRRARDCTAPTCTRSRAPP